MYQNRTLPQNRSPKLTHPSPTDPHRTSAAARSKSGVLSGAVVIEMLSLRGEVLAASVGLKGLGGRRLPGAVRQNITDRAGRRAEREHAFLPPSRSRRPARPAARRRHRGLNLALGGLPGTADPRARPREGFTTGC